VFTGTTWLGLGARGFGYTNLVLIAAWLAAAFLLLRQYGRIMRQRVEAAAGGPPA
jgi:hypothetical protein